MRLTSKKTKRFEVPNDPDGSYINIVHLKDNVVEEIKSRTSETKLVGDDIVVEVNGYAQKTELVKACLVGWGSFFDESGKELKFTPLNVSKSAEFSIVVGEEKTDFYAWIDKCREELAGEVEAETEKALVN